MSRTTVLLSLLTAFGGSILVATACAPQDDKTPVKVVSKTVASKAVDECLSQVRGREAKVSKRFVNVCEIPFEAQVASPIATDSASTPPEPPRANGEGQIISTAVPVGASSVKPYKLSSREVRYTVGHRDNKISIALNVGVSYPQNQPRGILTGVHRILSEQCVPKIEAMWRRENVELNLEINAMKDGVYYDQDLYIVAYPTQKDTSFPRWVAAGWPDAGDLYPVGRPDDESECKILGNGEDAQKCRWDRYEAANERFCVSLALKVGEWLGLEDPRSKSCGEVSSASTAATPEAPMKKQETLAQGSAAGSFMKTAEDPAAQGKAFWEKAKVTGVDLKTVLGPACPTFKALRENPAR